MRIPGFADIAEPDDKYIWEGYFLENEVNMITGEPGKNKSTFSRYFIAKFSRRQDPYGNQLRVNPGNVLVFTLEDSDGDVKKMYRYFGGHPERFSCIYEEFEFEDGSEPVPVSFDHLDLIRQAIAKRKAKLVVFDMFASFFGEGSINSRTYVDTLMRALRRMCKELETTMLLVHHSKGRVYHEMDCYSGSEALRRALRRAFFVGQYGLEDSERIIVPIKGNKPSSARLAVPFTVTTEGEGKATEFRLHFHPGVILDFQGVLDHNRALKTRTDDENDEHEND